MFLKKEKDPTTKLIDDDELVRSWTEAQETTGDIPEEVSRTTHKRSTLKRRGP